jgi:hypothetical protein
MRELLDMFWPLKQSMAAPKKDPMAPSILFECIAILLLPGDGR